MRRAVAHYPEGNWPEEKVSGTVSLTHDERHRRRFRLTDDAGSPFLLDLENAVRMADGDGLELEDGGFIRVKAKPEPVVDLVCASPEEAARLSWHIGNRHAPAQICTGNIVRIAADHVLIDMAEGLGARAARHTAPFNPESGAYSGGHGHGESHGHDH